jgi:hypothetical protein
MPGSSGIHQVAYADPSISGPDSADDGETIDLDIDSDDDLGDLVISVSGGNSPELDNVSCTPSCSGEISGEGTDEVTIDTDDIDTDTTEDSLSVSVELLVDCDDGDTLTVTVEDEGDEDTLEIDCGGASADGNITIRVDAEDAESDDDFEFELESDDNSCDGDNFTLNDGDVESFDCDDTNSDNTITVSEMPSGFTIEQVECDDEGISSSDLEIDEDDGTVTFTLGVGDTIDCTFTFSGDSTPAATATPTAVTPTSVSLSAGPNSVGCSGASFITITVRGAGNAPVSDGTAVQVAASMGVVSPSSQTTQGGGALVLYTAPSNQSGNATITATSGGRTGTTTVQVNCQPAAPTPVPQAPTPVPTATGGGIRPPSTGDAGLATESNGSSYALIAAIAAVSSLAGIAVASRLRG